VAVIADVRHYAGGQTLAERGNVKQTPVRLSFIAVILVCLTAFPSCCCSLVGSFELMYRLATPMKLTRVAFGDEKLLVVGAALALCTVGASLLALRSGSRGTFVFARMVALATVLTWVASFLAVQAIPAW
jgi:hypothetical protein